MADDLTPEELLGLRLGLRLGEESLKRVVAEAIPPVGAMVPHEQVIHRVTAALTEYLGEPCRVRIAAAQHKVAGRARRLWRIYDAQNRVLTNFWLD